MMEKNKIEKLNKQLLYLNKETTKNKIALILSILLILFTLNNNQELDNETLNKLLSILGTYLSVSNLKKMIENITKKSNIELLLEIEEEKVKKLTNQNKLW